MSLCLTLRRSKKNANKNIIGNVNPVFTTMDSRQLDRDRANNTYASVDRHPDPAYSTGDARGATGFASVVPTVNSKPDRKDLRVSFLSDRNYDNAPPLPKRPERRRSIEDVNAAVYANTPGSPGSPEDSPSKNLTNELRRKMAAFK